MLSTKHNLGLSDIVVAGPVRINPNAEAAGRLAEQYCQQLEIKLPNFADYTTMSRYLYPTASAERLAVIDLFMNMLWYIDDTYSDNDADFSEDSSAMDQELVAIYHNSMKILRTGVMPEAQHIIYPVCKFLHDKIIELSSQTWLDRLATTFHDHILATRNISRGAENIMVDGKLSVEKCREFRKLDSGMYPTMNFIEFARGIYLPDEVLYHPELYLLGEYTLYYGLTTNDLFSYYKEVIKGKRAQNMLHVVMQAKDLSLEEAADYLVRDINGYLSSFLQRKYELPSFGSAEIDQMVAEYVEGLEDQFYASWYWQIGTNRYRDPNQVFPELRTRI